MTQKTTTEEQHEQLIALLKTMGAGKYIIAYVDEDKTVNVSCKGDSIIITYLEKCINTHLIKELLGSSLVAK